MRFAIKLIAGLIVVVVGAVIVVPLTLDLNAYKGTIAQLVRGATGRQLEIAGDVQLNMGATPSITMEKVSFANAHWGFSPHMMKLDRFTADVELWPLLTEQINIRRVVLNGARVVLEKDAGGAWQLAVQQAAAGRGGTG